MLKRWAAWASNLTLVVLPLFLHMTIALDRHPEAAPALWGMKTMVDFGLSSPAPAMFRNPVVGVLILVLVVVYAAKLLATLSVPSWRAPGHIVALLLGLVILVAPAALGRAGVCAYDLHIPSEDEIISYAITKNIKDGVLGPEITSLNDYFNQYARNTCCKATAPTNGIPGISNLFAEFMFGRRVDVVYASSRGLLRTRIDMCSRSVWWWLR